VQAQNPCLLLPTLENRAASPLAKPGLRASSEPLPAITNSRKSRRFPSGKARSACKLG